MSPRSTALVALLALVVPLASTAGASPQARNQPTVNGTRTGPQHGISGEPGTLSTRPLPDMDRLDPARYSRKDAIVEHALVPSRNGIDTIWVDIVRPQTKPGVTVPVIMDASPYFNTLGRGWQGRCKTPAELALKEPGSALGGCTKTEPFPEFYDDYFVPRGYAVALMDLRGTRNTSGCQTYGARDEVYDAVDVVDYLVEQSWSNGKVGLTGGSYDGTIANGVAIEQPISGRHKNAVTAVVPIRAIDRWYDYHFFNGVPWSDHELTAAEFTTLFPAEDTQSSGTADPLLPARIAQRKACIATLGAYTVAGYAPTYQDAKSPFWSERDFATGAAGTKAAFFLIHGLYDFNVKTVNVGQMWAALPADAPKKLWLEDGDHVDPDTPDAEIAKKAGHVFPYTFQRAYRVGVHRWWAQFLKGLPAGALDTPTVEVQGADGRWSASRQWPLLTRDSVLSLRVDHKLGVPDGGTMAYDDGNPAGRPSQAFVTLPFRRATRLSGQVVVDLLYTLDGPDTNFAVRIDDLAPGTADDVQVKDTVLDDEQDGAFTVSYAWAKAFYRDSIRPRGASTATGGSPVVPGEVTRTTFGSLPLDFTIARGHRLRFTFSPSEGGTEPARTGGTVTLLVGKHQSSVTLPIAVSP